MLTTREDVLPLAEIKIALAGNPNSGKTTMFNDLTGSSQYVGNWPGVTVEKKEGRLKGRKDVLVQDLPGIYSLSPYSMEEVVSRTYILDEKPDALLNLIDASNLERNLYLTTQLRETGIPMVIALNMMDLVNKRGDKIDTAKLSKALNCPVMETSALKSTGSKEAADKALEVAEQKVPQAALHRFSVVVEKALEEISALITSKIPKEQVRFFAVKAFERDKKAMERLKLSQAEMEKLESIITLVEEKEDEDSESIITNQRYQYIDGLMKKVMQKKNQGSLSVSDRIDKVVTNRILALPIFAVVMWLVYYVSIQTIGAIGSSWVNDTLFGKIVPNAVGGFLTSIQTAEWLKSLLLDGIIAGVGAVLGFLPQMMVLFLCLAILEDSGYMARIAFIMDRIFRKFGLSGKSFIPILVSAGCGVPGIMASRTIENEKDRRMTVMVTTFIPCSAKLPIIALIAGALFPQSTWVGPSAYFLGIMAIVLSGIILKKTKLFTGDPSPFVMELPAYHLPQPKGLLIHVWDRSKHFVLKAGTVIFVSSAIIWFLSSFSFRMEMVEQKDSILAALGTVIAPIFAPLGWGNWQSTVATIVGLTAKENVVGTLGILYGSAGAAREGAELWPALQAVFTQVTAYSFLVFNLLCAPCFAAISAIRREMGSIKWTWIAIGYQTILAYVTAFLVTQLGNFIVLGAPFGFGQAAAVLLLGWILWLITRSSQPKAGRSAYPAGNNA
jgi:ferrous iron transport protein B